MSDDTQDIQELMAPRQPMLFGSPKSGHYRYYFFGPVRGPENYIDLINVLDAAQEGDEVHLMINTPGGRLDATLSIVHAMNRTKAHVVCHADGDVASAGSIIFFNGHSWVVNPFATFMLHDGSGGTFGKIGQNVKAAQAVQENLDFLYRSVYRDFFSEEEIDEILRGSDHYSNADQIADRVEAVMEDRREETASTENLKAILGAMGYDEGTVSTVAELLEDPKVKQEDEDECLIGDDDPELGTDWVGDSILMGSRVQVVKPGLKNFKRYGKVIGLAGSRIRVKIDYSGQIIEINPHNLEVVE